MKNFHLRDITTSLRRVMAVVPTDGFRPGFELVQWHVWPDRIVLVGSDGCIIVEVQHDKIEPQEPFDPFVAGLPIASMRALVACADAQPFVNVNVEGDRWTFNDTVIATAGAQRLPDTAKVYKLVGDTPMRLTVARDLLRKAVQIAPRNCSVMTTQNALILSGHNFRAIVMGMLTANRETHPFTSLLD